MEVTSTAPRRGRVVSSRYMNATTSSRAAAVSAAKKPTGTTQEKASKNLASERRTIKGNAGESSKLSKKPATPEAPAAKQRTVASNTSDSRTPSTVPGKSSRPPVQISLGNKAAAAFELDIASQLYPWIYMRHTLLESSNIAVAEFQEKIAARVNDLEAEEKALEENRIRYYTGREIQLLDDLSPQHLCHAVPGLIRKFVLSQERCQVAIVNATQLQGTNWETLCAVQPIMQDLDQLAEESNGLRESSAALLCTLPPDSLLASTLEGLLSVLDMRLENLVLSTKLLATIRGNAKNLQHLDSLRVLVEVEDSDDPDM